MSDEQAANIRELLTLIHDVIPTLARRRAYRPEWTPGRDPARMKRVPRALYFVRAGDAGPIKIGSAADPADRLNTLQVGCPERLFLLASFRGEGQREHELHALFAHLRLREDGEWFRPGQDLLAYIAAMRVARNSARP